MEFGIASKKVSAEAPKKIAMMIFSKPRNITEVPLRAPNLREKCRVRNGVGVSDLIEVFSSPVLACKAPGAVAIGHTAKETEDGVQQADRHCNFASGQHVVIGRYFVVGLGLLLRRLSPLRALRCESRLGMRLSPP